VVSGRPNDKIDNLRREAGILSGLSFMERRYSDGLRGRTADSRNYVRRRAAGGPEDRDGHPFVGPAGQLLNKALAEAGVDRERVYVTNAVKHFKFEPRGKRRLHKRPNAGEIKICRRWLFDEINAIGPQLIVALGATAAQSLAERAILVQANRGKILDVDNGLRVFMTIHPSALLRLQDEEEKRSGYASFVNDLRSIQRLTEPSAAGANPGLRKAG